MKLLLLIFFSAIALNAQEISESYSQDSRYWKKEVTVTFEKLNTLRMFETTTAYGEIEMRSSDKKYAYAVIELQSRERDKEDAIEDFFEEVEVNADVSGNTAIIDIDSEGQRHSNYWNSSEHQIHITLYLINNISVDVETRGGSISGKSIIANVKAKTSGGSINMDGVTGKVDVKTSGGSLNFKNIDGLVVGYTSGGSINVDNINGNVDIRTSGGGIFVENIKGYLECRTSGGGIRIEQVEKYVNAKTSGGGIDISDIGEKANVATSGGAIMFSNIGDDFSAETSGGSIRGKNVTGYSELSTNSGRIQATDMKGPVNAESNGNIEVEMDLSNYKGNKSSYFSNSFGNIELTLTDNSSFNLDVRSRSYGNSKKNIRSDFDIKTRSKNRAEYSHNGGKHEIKIDARGGKVRIYQK